MVLFISLMYVAPGDYMPYVHEAAKGIACCSVSALNKLYAYKDTVEQWLPWVVRFYGVYGGFVTALLFYIVSSVSPEQHVSSSWYVFGDAEGLDVAFACNLAKCCLHGVDEVDCFRFDGDSGVKDPQTLKTQGAFAMFCFLFAAILATVCSLITVAAWHKQSMTKRPAWKAIAGKVAIAAKVSCESLALLQVCC